MRAGADVEKWGMDGVQIRLVVTLGLLAPPPPFLVPLQRACSLSLILSGSHLAVEVYFILYFGASISRSDTEYKCKSRVIRHSDLYKVPDSHSWCH
jgi:hypothetical protein